MSSRLALPVGFQALVMRYGASRDEAIDKCVEVVQQLPPLLSELEDGDIVVAVRATEIVWTDTVMATGQYQHKAATPYPPGMTYSGEVVWSSEKAQREGITLGQRVAIAGPETGPRSLGRHQRWGGCASYAVAPYTAVRSVPDHWSFEQAACFAYGYDTAYHILVECGKVQPGDTVLIHGATGGVGIPAVHVAKMLGATVIATTRSDKKIDFLRSLGVDHTVVIGDEDGGVRKFRDDVKRLSGGGVSVVYDGVGGDAITVESMRCCRFGARILIAGWAATPDVAGGGDRKVAKPNLLPTNLMMMKGLHVIGCPAMISTRFDKELAPRRQAALDGWFREGKLPPPTIASTYPLAEVRKALHERVNSGSVVGSTIVCTPTLQPEIGKSKL